MLRTYARRPWRALWASCVLTVWACQGGSAPIDPSSCTDAVARLTELRVQKRSPRMNPEHAQRHAAQIAEAAGAEPIRRCQSLTDTEKRRLVSCMSTAESVRDGRECFTGVSLTTDS